MTSIIRLLLSLREFERDGDMIEENKLISLAHLAYSATYLLLL